MTLPGCIIESHKYNVYVIRNIYKKQHGSFVTDKTISENLAALYQSASRHMLGLLIRALYLSNNMVAKKISSYSFGNRSRMHH